jgi:DNA-binding Xre family transcriptional regulator
MQYAVVMEKVKKILSEGAEKRIFDKDIAAALGITKEHLCVLKRRDKIPFEELTYFCAKHKISINWLLFDQEAKSLVETTERFSRIRYYEDIHASAGGGAEFSSEENSYLMLDDEIIARLGIGRKIESVEAINIVGNSMEPTLQDGALAFVDTTNKEFRKGGVFVVSAPAGLFVKRLSLRLDGGMELISDNKNYPPEVVNAEDLKIIGKVIGTLGDVA